MNAVIYVCHGSRVPKGIEEAVRFIKRLMKNVSAPIQEYCFLELAEPTIEGAFRRVVNQGAAKIVVIPVLLLSAAHVKRDIPNEINRAASSFPGVKIIYGSPIGVHQKMIGPLIERIKETGEALTDSSLVLIVGRGSSDPDAKRDFSKIADMVRVNTKIQHVETCFLTAAGPSLEEGLAAAGAGNYDKVFIIPYLLFAGVLTKTIGRVIETHPFRDKYILCNYLGYHRSIEEILLDQVYSLLYD